MILWTLLLLSARAEAGAPVPPYDLGAQIFNYQNDVAVIRINWNLQLYGSRPQGCVIYRATGLSQNIAMFSRIDSILVEEDDTVAFWNDSIPDGIYSFLVTSYNIYGESQASNIIVVDARRQTSVRFVTSPPTRVIADDLYSYDAVATASNGSVVEYRLLAAPDGMRVDSATGRVEWIPTERGSYLVRLRAHLLGYDPTPGATQEWRIQVRDCERSAVIRGTVRDTAGRPVSGGLVQAIGPTFDLDSIVLGAYHLEVDSGSYFLFARGGFEPHFVGGASDSISATRFVVACGDTVEQDIVVMPRRPAQYYTVGGRVASATTDLPAPSTVYLYVRDVDGNYGGDWLFKSVQTDGEGNYSLDAISDEYTYIALARPVSDSLLPLYYYNASSYDSARAITLSGDLGSVNFHLPARVFYQNSLTGIVVKKGGAPVAARVTATLADPSIYLRKGEDRSISAYTDSLGQFAMTSLYPGEYFVQVIPSDPIYCPGYYQGKAFTPWSWSEATTVRIGSTSDISDLYLKLQDADGMHGANKLFGTVTHEGGYPYKSETTVQGIVPVEGATIYVIDQQDHVSGWAITDYNGEYQIENIGTGTYRILVDMIDFEPRWSSVTFSDGNGLSEYDCLLSRNAFQSAAPADHAIPVDLAVYPNPGSDDISVRFLSQSGSLEMVLVNGAGEVMSSRRIDTFAGENLVRLQTDGLPDGIYFLRLNDGLTLRQAAVVVIR